MESYLIYIGVAITTILLPGPAVMLTINNSIQKGLLKSFAGILGISLAILLVAIISATSLGVVLASSAVAFNIIKITGSVYLIYLGIKMLRSEVTNNITKEQEGSFLKCFMDGFLVSVSNPKAVIFFMSIFPQFIDLTQEYTQQFILLAATFSFLVIVIHTIYAVFAFYAKSRLSSRNDNAILNKISGGVFISFGVGLAASGK